jgi:hypothetical protein
MTPGPGADLTDAAVNGRIFCFRCLDREETSADEYSHKIEHFPKLQLLGNAQFFPATKICRKGLKIVGPERDENATKA